MWWVSWVSIKSSSPTTRILESLESYAPKDMFKDVLSSVVSKSKNLKTTQIHPHQWESRKYNVVYSPSRMLLTGKSE